MQQRINDKATKSPKHDSPANAQTPPKTEESSSILKHDYNPLENISCKIGDNVCAAKHVSVAQRTGLFHPMNGNRKVQSLLKLQQQYGNRFVQRVIAQDAIQTKLTTRQPGSAYGPF